MGDLALLLVMESEAKDPVRLCDGDPAFNVADLATTLVALLDVSAIKRSGEGGNLLSAEPRPGRWDGSSPDRYQGYGCSRDSVSGQWGGGGHGVQAVVGVSD